MAADLPNTAWFPNFKYLEALLYLTVIEIFMFVVKLQDTNGVR